MNLLPSGSQRSLQDKCVDLSLGGVGWGGYGGVSPMIISLRDSIELHFVLELQKQKPMYLEASKLS